MIGRLLSKMGYERRANGDDYWERFAALRTSAISPASAESLSAVNGCVSAIAETIGSLPLHMYRKTDIGRERATDHPLTKVLHDQPNERQSALEFREMQTATMLLRGNSFARIVRDSAGQVRELRPVHPDRVTVIDLDNGRLGYEVSGKATGIERLTQDEVFHLRHRSDDGVLGVSPITRAAAVLELAAAERDHGITTFSNGAKLLGVLKVPGRLSPEQRTTLATSWKAYKSGGTAVLDDGADFMPVSVSMEDAQWIEARRFSVDEIARIFRVPPVIIGAMESANYSNSVELARQFVTLSLRRHLVAWEQAISRQLMTTAGRRTYTPEHAVEGLLRGDSKTRAEFYQSAIQNQWMTIDEVRELENLPRITNHE